MTEKKSPHITAARNQAKLNNLATERFRVVNGKVKKCRHDAQNVETVVTAAIAAERLINPQVGDLVPGKGIFFGELKLVNQQDESLSKVFNMYAAPEDLSDENGNTLFHYADALSNVAALKDWHGHDGTNYADDTEFFAALQNGSYKGGWFIPPRDLLKGPDNGGIPVSSGTLYAHHNEGDFKGTFQMEKSMGTVRPDFYWSSTKLDTMPYADHRFAARMLDGIGVYYNAKALSISCRPIRLELKP